MIARLLAVLLLAAPLARADTATPAPPKPYFALWLVESAGPFASLRRRCREAARAARAEVVEVVDCPSAPDAALASALGDAAWIRLYRHARVPAPHELYHHEAALALRTRRGWYLMQSHVVDGSSFVPDGVERLPAAGGERPVVLFRYREGGERSAVLCTLGDAGVPVCTATATPLEMHDVGFGGDAVVQLTLAAVWLDARTLAVDVAADLRSAATGKPVDVAADLRSAATGKPVDVAADLRSAATGKPVDVAADLRSAATGKPVDVTTTPPAGAPEPARRLAVSAARFVGRSVLELP